MSDDVPRLSEIVRLLSVTSTIREGLGKNEGMLYWSAGEAADCALDQRAVIDAMLASGQPKGEVWKWIRDARKRTMQYAAARGTDLHKAAELYAKGVDPHVSDEIAPFWEQYRRWLDTWNPTQLMAEAAVYNPSEGYAGTLDGIVELNGQVLLYDIKTTAHGPNAVNRDGKPKRRPPFPEVALQLAAYARATHVGILPPQREEQFERRWYDFDTSASYESMPSVDGALCIVVSPEDCFAKEVSIGERSWATFKRVREIARWNRTWGDTGALFGVELRAEQQVLA